MKHAVPQGFIIKALLLRVISLKVDIVLHADYEYTTCLRTGNNIAVIHINNN